MWSKEYIADKNGFTRNNKFLLKLLTIFLTTVKTFYTITGKLITIFLKKQRKGISQITLSLTNNTNILLEIELLYKVKKS